MTQTTDQSELSEAPSLAPPSQPTPASGGMARWVAGVSAVAGTVGRWIFPHAAARRAAESVLHNNEQRLSALFENASVGIAEVGLDGRYVRVNQRLCDITGYTRRELLNRTFQQITHPDDLEDNLDNMRRALVGETTTYEAEKRYIRKDGATIWVNLSVSLMRLADGQPSCFVSVVEDINARKQAEESLRQRDDQLRLITDALPALISYIDNAYRYRLVNRTYERWFGLPPDQTIGSHVREVLGAEAWETLRSYMERALGGEEVSFQQEVPYRGGARWVHVQYTPDRDPAGMVRGFVVLVTDISERVSIERQLMDAKAAAEAASSAKDHFLAVLSHELRTPLTPVLTVVQMLERDSTLSEQARDDLKTIRRNVELETRLIDDLLDLTRISRGKLQLHLHDLDIHDKLRHVIGICNAEMRGKQIELSLDLTAQRHCAHGDGARLQQVFWNLLKNAVKFTSFGGRIWLRTEDGPDGQLVVSVRDNGVGIEPEVLPRLFSAFEQGSDGVTRQFGGLGLGLSIARGLVELHGGTIRASSEGKGRGATFILTLPAKTPPLAVVPAPKSSSATERPASVRILLVEDHPDTARAMVRILNRAGHTVHAADSVAAALRIAEAEPFDLVVSDIGLPDGSGLDLMRQLRLVHPCLRGIALSGFGMEEDVRRSREAGFEAHLTKPIDLTTFEQTLARLAGELAHA